MSALAEALVAAQRRALQAVEKACGRKSQPEPEDFDLLTKKQASEVIDALDSGSYDPAKWRVPF